MSVVAGTRLERERELSLRVCLMMCLENFIKAACDRHSLPSSLRPSSADAVQPPWEQTKELPITLFKVSDPKPTAAARIVFFIYRSPSPSLTFGGKEGERRS